MQVRITNVTDGPGKKPVEVRIYNKRLRPGARMDVPVQFVDDKTRKLEEAGFIIIGKLPPWYADYEARRKVRNLTVDEVTENVQLKKAQNTKETMEVLKKELEREELPLVTPVVPETEESRKRIKR